MPLRTLIPEVLGTAVLVPGQAGAPGGPGGAPPPKLGNGWEILVLRAPDYFVPLAWIPARLQNSLSFSMLMKDQGSGTVVLNQDDPWWTTTRLGDGTAAHALLDSEHLWQVWQDGVLRFDFLGETVTEQLADPSEQRLVTITGPGTAAVLTWGAAMPPGFPANIIYKTDALTDGFSETDANGHLVLDTGLWNATSSTGVSINPSGSVRLTGTSGGSTLGSTVWDITNSLVSAQVSPIVSPDAAGITLDGTQLTQLIVRSQKNSAFYVLIGLSGSFLYGQYSGPDGTATHVIASAAQYGTVMSSNSGYSYWQITEVSGTFYFWTSPDGETWAKQWSVKRNWDASQVGVFFAAAYDTGASEFATVTAINSSVQASSLGGALFFNEPIMSVWLANLQAAQARGTIPMVTTRMSASTDSFGRPWTDSQSVQIQNGTDLYALLQGHAGMINADWLMAPGFQLQVGIPGTAAATTLANDFEEGLNQLGQTITAANSGGSGETAFAATSVVSGGTLAYDASLAAAYGTVAAKTATGATAGKSYVQLPAASSSLVQYFRVYVYLTASPSAALGLVWAGTAGNATAARLNITTSGKLSMDTAGAAGVIATNTSIALNQWVRIEGFVVGDPAAGQVSMSLYNSASSTTPTERADSAANQNTAGPPAIFQFGVTGPGNLANAGPFWMDQLAVSDFGYPGPAGTKPASSAGTTGAVTLGADRSTTVRFRENGDELTKQRIRSRKQLANLVAAINSDGRTVVAQNNVSIAEWGQREQWVQAAVQVTTQDVEVVAEATVEAEGEETLSWTLGITPNETGRTVFRDFSVGDWVGLERPDFSAVDAVRVIGISVAVDQNGTEQHELVLSSYIQWLIQNLQYIATKMGGGFISSTGTTAVGSLGDLTQSVPTVFSPTLGSLGFPGSGTGGAPPVYNPVTGTWQTAGSTDPVTGQPLSVIVPGPSSQSVVSGTGITVANTVSSAPLNANPDFTGGTAGWSAANATLSVTGSPQAGSPQPSAAVVTPTSSSGVLLSATQKFAVQGGMPYVLSAWVWLGSQADMGIVQQISWFNAQGALISADSVDTVTDAGTWRQLIWQDFSPAAAMSATIAIGPHTGVNTNPLQVTDFKLLSAATTANGSVAVTPTGTVVTDTGGNVRVVAGVQSDGTVTVVESNGPPPGAPDAPVLTGAMLSLVVGWDGLLAGAGPPLDFRYCEIHLSTTSGFTPSAATLQGTEFVAGGIKTISQLTAGTTYFARLVAVNRSGNKSPASPQASAVVQSVSQNIPPGAISASQVSFTVSGITVTLSATAPASPNTGDLWYDATNGYRLNQWNGSAWVPFQFGTNAIAAGSITAALIAANTVTAAQIAAGTITATQIAAGTITTSLLAAGIVVAGIVNGTVVTGSTVQNNSANPRTSINPDGSVTIRNSAGNIVWQAAPDGTLSWYSATGVLLAEKLPTGAEFVYSSSTGPAAWDFEPPGMGVPVQVASMSSIVSAASYTTPGASAAVAAGDCVVVIASSSGADTATGVTDTQGNSYTRVVNVTSNQFLQIFAAYGVKPLSTSDTWTVTYGAANTHNKNIVVLDCPGVAQVAALDNASQAGGTSTAPSASVAPVAPQGDLALFVTSSASAGGVPSAVSDGWLQVGQASGSQLTVAWASATASTATLAPSATIVSANWSAAVLTLIAQDGGQALNGNPQFSGGTLTGWTAANAAAGGTTAPPAGSPFPDACMITPSSSANVLLAAAGTPVIAQQYYTMSGWAYLPSQADMRVVLEVQWYNGSLGLIRTDAQTVTLAAASWTQVVFSELSPAGAVTAVVAIGPNTGVLTNPLTVTGVQISSDQPWSSVLPGASAAFSSAAASTAWSFDGQYSLKVSSLGTGSPTHPWGAASPWFKVVPGAPVTMQAEIFTPAVLSAMSVGFGWYTAAGAFISSSTGDQGTFATTAGGVALATITGATAPPGAAWASFFVQDAFASSSGTSFSLDTVQVAGGLAYSNSPVSTVDFYGNQVPQGSQYIGLPGLTNVLSVQDPWGHTLAGVDASGNISATQLIASGDVLIGGASVSTALSDGPTGLLNSGWTPVGPWPSGAIGTTETALLELDQRLTAGRSYDVELEPFNLQGSNNGNYRIYINVYFTTDGSTPTTSSPALVSNFPLNMPATSQGSCWNMHPGYRVTVNPATSATYRFLVAGHTAGTSSGTFQVLSSMRLDIIDQGIQTSLNTVNNGIALGSGSSGSSGAQNFTENFFASGTWAYWGSGALRDTDATMYQGAQPGVTGPQTSFIRFGSGDLGNNLNTVLNYTVQSVTLKLSCGFSYLASGVTVSFHSSTSLGNIGSIGSELQNWVMASGQVISTPLSTSAWAPFKAGGTTYAVLHPPGGSTSTKYYGSFYGQSGGGNPLLTVVYSH